MLHDVARVGDHQRAGWADARDGAAAVRHRRGRLCAPSPLRRAAGSRFDQSWPRRWQLGRRSAQRAPPVMMWICTAAVLLDRPAADSAPVVVLADGRRPAGRGSRSPTDASAVDGWSRRLRRRRKAVALDHRRAPAASRASRPRARPRVQPPALRRTAAGCVLEAPCRRRRSRRFDRVDRHPGEVGGAARRSATRSLAGRGRLDRSAAAVGAGDPAPADVGASACRQLEGSNGGDEVASQASSPGAPKRTSTAGARSPMEVEANVGARAVSAGGGRRAEAAARPGGRARAMPGVVERSLSEPLVGSLVASPTFAALAATRHGRSRRRRAAPSSRRGAGARAGRPSRPRSRSRSGSNKSRSRRRKRSARIARWTEAASGARS